MAHKVSKRAALLDIVKSMQREHLGLCKQLFVYSPSVQDWIEPPVALPTDPRLYESLDIKTIHVITFCLHKIDSIADLTKYEVPGAVRWLLHNGPSSHSSLLDNFEKTVYFQENSLEKTSQSQEWDFVGVKDKESELNQEKIVFLPMKSKKEWNIYKIHPQITCLFPHSVLAQEIPLYLVVFQISANPTIMGTLNAQNEAIGIISAKRIDEKEFDVYLTNMRAPIKCHVSSQLISMDQVKLDDLVQFQGFFADLFGYSFASDNDSTDNSILICPCSRTSHGWHIDWDALKGCTSKEQVKQPRKPDSNSILSTNHGQTLYFSPTETSLSLEDGFTRKGDFVSFREHFENIGYSSFDTNQSPYRVLPLRRIKSVCEYMHGTLDTQESEIMLIRESFMIHPLSMSRYLQLYSFPEVLQYLKRHMHLARLIDRYHLHHIPTKDILPCLTKISANLGIDYDRNECIGDAFIKFIVGEFAFSSHPNASEEILTDSRKMLINNSYLNDFSKLLGTDEMVFRCMDLESERIGLSCFIRQASVFKRNKSKKLLADCFEALVGTLALNDEKEARRFLYETRLISPIPIWIPSGTPALLQDTELLESKISYTFRDKSIASRAFTHASASLGYDFQSFEFLGDAILDWIIIKLALTQPNMSKASDISDFKRRFTSNQTMQGVGRTLGIGQFLIGSEHLKSVLSERNYEHKVVGDLVEALICAIYLDTQGDFATTEKAFRSWIKCYLIENEETLTLI